MFTNRLHIYAQQWWHDEAYIVGDREALEELYSALGRALHGEDGNASCEPFTADGEGYPVYVIFNEDEVTWKQLLLPYTDGMAKDNRRDGLHPSSLVKGD